MKSTINFNNTEVAFAYKNNKELKKTYRIFQLMQFPFLYKMGFALPSFTLRIGWITSLIKKTIFDQFVAGETLPEAWKIIDKFHNMGIGSILDYGVEYQQEKTKMDEAMEAFILSITYKSEESDSSLKQISIKITALLSERVLLAYSNKIGTDTFAFESEIDDPYREDWMDGIERVREICQKGKEQGVGILIDAEESWIQAAIDYITNKMMMEFNTQSAVVFNTFQLYRKDKLSFLKESLERARKHPFLLGAKIVRGAYIEKENEYAKRRGIPSAIFESKELSDASFDEGMFFCLEHREHMYTVIATHNENSIQKAVQYIEAHNIESKDERFSFSQLYGMGDNLSFNLATTGFNVSKYLPYGEVRFVFGYLLRRAKENSSIKGQSAREFSLLKKEMIRRHLL